jgi:AraC-like DNA-binding protein
MKTLIQKIHLEKDESFACRVYKTPIFETNWHKHEEFELIVITEGNGTAMIGDYIGEYKQGDVFFLASNLPHWFRKNHSKMIGCAVVIHFANNIFKEGFIAIPEMKSIAQLLQKNNGIQFEKKIKKDIENDIVSIEKSKGINRVIQLLQCLQKISTTNSYKIITKNFADNSSQINPAIEKIIDYTFKNFLSPITLKEVAKVAEMSIPSFCRFFKKNIKKTYFDFLQDIRISHACKLLNNTNKPIMEVCYESGYNSWSHFSKQFKTVTKMTPSSYKKKVSE